MSRFASDKTKKIELGDGEWVEIKEKLPYKTMEPIITELDQENEMKNIKLIIPLMKAGIVSWNFKDEDGKDVPYKPGLIDKLDTNTIMEIMPSLFETYMMNKKKQTQSEK